MPKKPVVLDDDAMTAIVGGTGIGSQDTGLGPNNQQGGGLIIDEWEPPVPANPNPGPQCP